LNTSDLHITSNLLFAQKKDKPFLIAGPCSAESRIQVLETGRALAKKGDASIFRAGVWKPRTRPGSFEGIGEPALGWLQDLKAETGMPVATEVANAHHVEACLKNNIDYLWIGARTTVNPFYVQEIAEALRGVDIPVLVKNPLHPDIGLWIGALERFNKCGINQLMAIHRGFYSYEATPYRNVPKWDLAIKLKRSIPNLPIICDPSHIAGDANLISDVSQIALDLDMDGFMIESHCDPASALSDAKQQITPEVLHQLMNDLIMPKATHESEDFNRELNKMRSVIDKYDNELLDVIQKRMKLVAEIGKAKKENNVTTFQIERFFHILSTRKSTGLELGLSKDMVYELFELIHKHSINIQNKI
jgi:chorismate mutase